MNTPQICMLQRGFSTLLDQFYTSREFRLVQASIIRDRGTNTECLLPSKAREEAIRLYRAVGQKLPRQTVLFKQGTTI